ncbi:MAG: acyl--CoA ligase [Burkholderiales bacterium]|nr:acyl--CoA ligase [Burkholderiales bacterium]
MTRPTPFDASLTHPTLQQTFGDVCRRFADKDAVVFHADGHAERHTFAQLFDDAQALACGLRTCGLRAGDHVGLWMPNCYEWILSRFAVALAGMVLVPLNTRLRSQDLSQLLHLSDAKALIVAERFKDIDYTALLAALGLIGERKSPTPLVISAAREPSPGTIGLHTLMRRPADGAEPVQASSDDVLNIIFTSGTTSLPKGAMIRNGAATLNMLRINERWGQRADDRFMLCAPLFTSAGLGRATACLIGGSTLVLQEGFAAREFLQVASEQRVTATALSDTNVLDLIDELAQTPALPPLMLRVVLGLFQPGVASKQDFLRRQLGVAHVLSHYGLSETSHMTTLCSPDDDPALCDASVGRPLPGVSVDIVDPDGGGPCACGALGEIRVGGYVVTPGYYKRPDASRELLDEQGRLCTGDLGWLDEAGFLHFHGRQKDIVRVGGFNVSAGEIENLLRAQPEIREAAVVPIPDPRLGEVPCAFVEFFPGTSLTVEALRARLRADVASFKIPRHLIAIDEWPRTGSEKIQKPALVGRAMALLGLDAEAR